MASRFDAAVEVLEAETGWRRASPAPGEASGQTRFALDGLEFFLRSPDDRHLYFLFRLARLAPGEDPNARARGYARMAAAAAKKRRTILSFHENAFYLHQEVDLTTTELERIPLFCQNFLNDCDWWRHNRPPAF